MKYKRVLIVFITISLLAFSLTGCGILGDEESTETDELEENQEEQGVPEEQQAEETSQETAVKMRQTVFYYANEDGYLEPMMMEIPWVTGIGKSAVSHLVDCEEVRQKLEGTGLKPVLPEGTEVIGMAIKEDGLAKINFNKEFLNTQNLQEEVNAVKAVVYTLTEFPTISRVRFMVEGKYIDKLPHGTNVSKALTRSDFE